MKLTGYIIDKCPSTTQIEQCDWHGDISECRISRDNGFNGGWYVYWICPKCGSTVRELNYNSPLNHPLQAIYDNLD